VVADAATVSAVDTGTDAGGVDVDVDVDAGVGDRGAGVGVDVDSDAVDEMAEVQSEGELGDCMAGEISWDSDMIVGWEYLFDE
jgi:hypothetical protein